MNKVEELTTKLLQPILKKHHFDLYDVSFAKKGPKWFLTIHIDKKNGISINDCALVSDELGAKLDSLDPDPIPHAYNLDISSPGVERPLRNSHDFEKAIHKYIHVSLYAPLKGRKMFEGYLENISDDSIVIKYNDMSVMRNLEIPKKRIAKARLAIKF